MLVVSKRFIAKGEEVTNNYGVHYTQVYGNCRLVVTAMVTNERSNYVH